MYSKNLNEINKFGLEIQKAKLDAASKKKGKNEPFAQGIDKWGASIDRVVQHNMSNGHKEKPAESFMKGMASGMSGSLRSQDNEEFEKVYDYFNSNLKNIEQTNSHNEAKQKKMDALSPYISTGLELMNSGLPHETVMPELKSIFEKAQMNNPDLKGNVVGYIPNSSFITVRDDTGNMKTISMASFVDPEDYKNIVKNNLDKQKLLIEQDPNSMKNKHKQAYIDDVNNRWDPSKQYDRNFSAEQAKKQADFVQEQEKRLQIIDNAELKLMSLKDLFESDTVISGKTLGAFAKRIFGAAFNTEGKSYTELMQAITNGLYSFMKDGNAFGNVNMKEFELQTKQAPDEMNTPKGNLKIIEYQLKRLTEERSRTKHIVDSYHNYNTQQPISPENPLPLTPGEQQAAGKSPMMQQTPTVKMKFPDGTTKEVPTAEKEKYKEWGVEVG